MTLDDLTIGSEQARNVLSALETCSMLHLFVGFSVIFFHFFINFIQLFIIFVWQPAVSNFCVLFHNRSLSAFREDSWFKSLFVRKVDPRKDAHSHLLAKKEDSNLYKIQCKCCL